MLMACVRKLVLELYTLSLVVLFVCFFWRLPFFVRLAKLREFKQPKYAGKAANAAQLYGACGWSNV
jgi:hypothetical protein